MKYLTFALASIICLGQSACQSTQKEKPILSDNLNDNESLPDLYEIWDYANPTKTREKFNGILIQALVQAKESNDLSYLLQLQTQIARTYSLEANFDSAHAILDDVEAQLSEDLPVVKIRYLLERGRSFNSSGDKVKALALFNDSYALSVKASEDNYAIDAAHMVAVAESDSAEKEKWNLIGVAIAEKSDDMRARNWLGSLYNNIGWDYFEQRRYPEALTKFEEALVYQVERGDSRRTNIARWCVAKGYRFVDRVDEALVIQQELLSEYKKSGANDGFVFEELGELFLLKGDGEQSAEYFALAFKELSQDNWLVENESARIERLRTLGKIESDNK